MEIPPDEREILEMFGLDQDAWTVTAMRQSRWQQAVDGEFLSTYRVSVQRRTSGAQFDVQTVASILPAYPVRPKSPAQGKGIPSGTPGDSWAIETVTGGWTRRMEDVRPPPPPGELMSAHTGLRADALRDAAAYVEALQRSRDPGHDRTAR